MVDRIQRIYGRMERSLRAESGFRRSRSGRGRSGGFLGFAGAEGVGDAPLAGAAAQRGGIELAEGELDLVPDVLDELVGGGAELVDVVLLAIEGVLGGGLAGTLAFISTAHILRSGLAGSRAILADC